MEKHAKKLMKSAKSNLAKAKRSYTCRSLKDLVRAYRACTTAAEERALVKKEAAHIRDLFREGDRAFRRQNIAKLLFFHMNGYPTSFGMTECIKLCASPKYSDKRVAYLGLMILVDETADILMLMTNCLKQDLLSSDRSIVSLALTVLADVASADMVRDLMPEISSLLRSPDPHLRKKALLASVRAARKLPRDELDDIIDALPTALDSNSPAVLCSAAALVSELAKKHPQDRALIAKISFPPFAAALRALLLSPARASDTTVSGVRSPFPTVKLLAALRTVAGPPEADALAQLVAQVAANTAHTHVIGCAVLYECVRCALAVPGAGDETLRGQTVEILGRFLAHKLASVRYVALQELVKVCAIPSVGSHVAAYRDTILSCLSEADPTVSQMAVELVYAIATHNDAKEMCTHLLEYLDRDHAPHHQQETCNKLFDLATRFGNDPAFMVDTFVAALDKVDLNMPEQLITAFAAFVSRDPQAQKCAVKTLYQVALADRSKRRKPRLERVATYIVGEYADLVVSQPEYGITPNAVVDALETALARSPVEETSWINTHSPEHLAEVARIRETALSALAKFAARHAGGAGGAAKGANGNGIDAGLATLALVPAQPQESTKTQLTGIAGDALAGLGLDDKALVPASDALVAQPARTDNDVLSRVRNTLLTYAASPDLETQQRACEYAALLAPFAASACGIALARFPPVDYDEIQRRATRRREDALRVANASIDTSTDLLALGDAPAPAPVAAAGAGKQSLADIDGLLGLPAPPPRNTQPQAQAQDPTGLDGLLGLPAPTTNASAVAPAQRMSAALGLEDLMGDVSSTPALAPAQARTAADILNTSAGTLGVPVGAIPADAEPVGSHAWEPTPDVSGALVFLRASGDPAVTRVRATFENKTGSSLNGFAFALAVPNGMEVRMEAASGDVIAPGGKVTQGSVVTNPLYDSKPVRLMYRVAYSRDGTPVSVQGKLRTRV